MRLYNTLTRQQDDFAPSRQHRPHVHVRADRLRARPHRQLPHLRGVDVLRRALKYVAGYQMHHVMNFTDVDDKTIAGAAKSGLPLREYTDQFITAFREDALALGIEPVEDTPRATDDENLKAMADMINALGERGHTYATDGSIYFKIATLPLRQAGAARSRRHAGRRPRRLRRVRQGDARDFVLWKATKAGEPSWDSAAARAVRAGTSSARRWRCACSANRRSTSTPAASTWSSRITRTRSRRAKAPPARSSRASGSMSSTCCRQPEDVEVARQLLYGPGRARQGVPAVGASLHPAVRHYRKQLNFTWIGLEQAEEALRRITDFLDAWKGSPRAARTRR